MIIVDKVLGNQENEFWHERLATASVEQLVLDQWEGQKNRLRKKTEGGTEVAISLERKNYLRDGDVLFWNESEEKAIVVVIHLKEVMIIRINPEEVDHLLMTSVELGHALGNQHWPAVVKDDVVYVPLSVDKKVMSSVMDTHHFHGVTYKFVSGHEVIPYLAPHEQRRLFGNPDEPVHSHSGHVHSTERHFHD